MRRRSLPAARRSTTSVSDTTRWWRPNQIRSVLDDDGFAAAPGLLALTAGRAHSSASAGPAQPPPPRPCLRRANAAFPFRPGQELAGRTLCRDARSVGMATSFAVTFRKQQGVGVHREQPSVAYRTRVRLRLLALGRAHLPPAGSVHHGSSLGPRSRRRDSIGLDPGCAECDGEASLEGEETGSAAAAVRR